MSLASTSATVAKGVVSLISTSSLPSSLATVRGRLALATDDGLAARFSARGVSPSLSLSSSSSSLSTISLLFTLAPPLPPTKPSSCNVGKVKLECLISIGSPLLANSLCLSTKALAPLTDAALIAILLANLLPVLLDDRPLCEQLFLVLSQR
ncbi:hypothetical protein C0989_000397 [Termitomyces sp. Mn162]|nr:hypothetical protein C0989_000397 [Termitomyces sp. Mn162]